VLGGLGFCLASLGGSIFNTQHKINNEIIHNSYFQNLIASGGTTKKDLELLEIIRPVKSGFIGVSGKELNWEQVRAVAERTGAKVLDVNKDAPDSQDLLTEIPSSLQGYAKIPLWTCAQRTPRILVGYNILVPESPEQMSPEIRHKVLLHWRGTSQLQPNRLSQQEKIEGFTLLFDGESLAGWRTMHEAQARPAWQVIDGAIQDTRDGGGNLITKGRFGDFDLRLEFRISSGANSGIFWRLQEDAGLPPRCAPEYQILDPAVLGDSAQSVDKTRITGALYYLFPSKLEWSNAVGEWNQARIVAEGTKLEIYLNGHLTVRTDSSSDDWRQRITQSKFKPTQMQGFYQHPEGHICLQDHGGTVAFRSIRIRSIPRTIPGVAPGTTNLSQKPIIPSEANPLDFPGSCPAHGSTR